MNAKQSQEEEFIQLLTEVQERLYCYIAGLGVNHADIQDVRQKASLRLWRQKDKYVPGSNFTAWAVTVAYYEVRSYRRDNKRDRHCFGDNMMELMTGAAIDELERFDARREALRVCLSKLPANQKWLIEQRYKEGKQVRQIAQATQKRSGSIATSIYRIRKTLRDCILIRSKKGII